eukprot:6067710-Amphidinium_carterae.1
MLYGFLTRCHLLATGRAFVVPYAESDWWDKLMHSLVTREGDRTMEPALAHMTNEIIGWFCWVVSVCDGRGGGVQA